MNLTIKKYASHSCVKCKLLDKVLKHLNLLDKTETVYIEDLTEDELAQLNATSVPILLISNGETTERLVGNILPQDIHDIVEKLNNGV